MNRLLSSLSVSFALVLLSSNLSSCVSASSLTGQLDEQIRSLQMELNQQTAKSQKLHARKAALMADGVAPGEEAQLSSIRQEEVKLNRDIASLKKQLSALAAAG